MDEKIDLAIEVMAEEVFEMLNEEKYRRPYELIVEMTKALAELVAARAQLF